jgi:2-iminobutanoate/2-iminopropanoate deaminase
MKRFLKPTRIAPAASGQPHGLAHGGVFKRLMIGGQVGADPSGDVPPGFEAQAELAFDNLLAVVEAAQLAVDDLTRLTAYVAAPECFAQYHLVRARKLGAATPVSTYVEVTGLGDPRWLISIEGEAIREADH